MGHSILYIPIEFSTWDDARYCSYTFAWGIEEALALAVSKCLTIPAIYGFSPDDPGCWLHHAKRLCAGKTFDQVWFAANHTSLNEPMLLWLEKLAPVRVGIVSESLGISDEEWLKNPAACQQRQDTVNRGLAIATHVVVVDEVDVQTLEERGFSACWLPPFIASSAILPLPRTPETGGQAVFYGALYGARQQLLDHPSLKPILVRPEQSLEEQTDLPARYDQLQAVTKLQLAQGSHRGEESLQQYLTQHRSIRRNCFELWLKTLQAAPAVVNLPQYGSMYSGRVVEAMAAGRPVIAARIAGRPRTAALFRDGHDILLYDPKDPEQLAGQIRTVLRDPAYGSKIAQAAQKTLKAGHTIEQLVREVLAWAAAKPAPISGCSKEPMAKESKNMSRHLPLQSGLVFDIGANIGTKAEEFVKQGFRVVCVEPQPEMLKALHQKFAQHSGVAIVGKALAEKPGVLAMSICKDAPTISTLSDEWKQGRFAEYTWDEQIDVAVTTLDQLIDDYGIPAYCKIDVEGYELQVLKGLSQLLPLISFEFTSEFIDRASSCTEHLAALGYQDFNFKIAESEDFASDRWLSPSQLFQQLHAVQDSLLWGDIYCRYEHDACNARVTEPTRASEPSSAAPLRLHLGCGEQYLPGYTNIDYPGSEHAVMNVKADLYADIATLRYPDSSVDEIRLHHVFEHFNRVTALALLIRWHEWLKPGGKLTIETPDLEGSARILLSDQPWQVKTASVRHLAGDHADTWAYHVDHWFPERFQRTLSRLGFEDVQTVQSNWGHEPYLANVTAVATKHASLSRDELLKVADAILLESTVSPSEKAVFAVWQKQLRNVLCGGEGAKPSVTSADLSVVPTTTSQLPLEEIQDFNQRSRDRWVADKAATVPGGSRVLDIGAGTCPYRYLFSHCDYKSHDFKKYTGEKLGGTSQYGSIDYVSEITSIPVADASFDVILCTEVLEHVPEPGLALQEMIRILRPGGRIFLTAPLGSGLHQLPYHYYGGFSPEWYRYWAAKSGTTVAEITPNGGFFRLLAQECNRAANLIGSSPALPAENMGELRQLLSDKLPRLFFAVEDTLFIDQFTVGYHVELNKPENRFDKIMRLKQARTDQITK